MDSIYQNLFDLMYEQHGLTLLQSEMQEIDFCVENQKTGQIYLLLKYFEKQAQAS